MKTGIKIGARPKAVKRVHKAIVSILQQKADQATLQKALDALVHAVQISNIAITGNSVIDQRKGE